jgi:hypothetical protein
MKHRSIYTAKLGKSLAEQALGSAVFKLHIISGDTNWRVVPEGRVKAMRSFSTIDQAIDFAKNLASKKTGQVVVHERNGNVKTRISYAIAS